MRFEWILFFWWIQNFELEMGRMITRPWFRCGSRPPDFLEKSPRPSPTLIMRVWRHRVCVSNTKIFQLMTRLIFNFFFYPENPTPLGWTRGIFQFAVKCRDVSAVESPRWDLIGLSSRWCGGGGGVNAVELQSESCCHFIRLCLPVRQMKVMLWCYL